MAIKLLRIWRVERAVEAEARREPLPRETKKPRLEVEAPATPPLAAPIDPVAAALAAAAANGAVPAAKATTAAAVPRVSVPRSSRSGSLRPGSLNTVPRPLKGCRDKDQDKDRDKDREPPPPLSE